MADEKVKEWHQRRCCYAFIALFLAGALMSALFLMTQFDAYFVQFFSVFLKFHVVADCRELVLVHSSDFLVCSIVCFIMATVAEVVSRRCRLLGSWRVRDELIVALNGLGLVQLDDVNKVKRTVKFKGFPRYTKENQCLQIRFKVVNVDATYKRLKRLDESPEMFKNAKFVEVSEDDSKGYKDGYILAVWYGENQFGTMKGGSPWA